MASSDAEFRRYARKTGAVRERAEWRRQRWTPEKRSAEQGRRFRCRQYERGLARLQTELELETFDSMPRPLKPPGVKK